MDYTEYAEAKRKAAKKISADIRERWNNRIVQRELHLMGEAGPCSIYLITGAASVRQKLLVLHCARSRKDTRKWLLAFGKERLNWKPEKSRSPSILQTILPPISPLLNNQVPPQKQKLPTIRLFPNYHRTCSREGL